MNQTDFESARQALIPASIVDQTNDVAVVDVTAWGERLDMRRLAAVGDPILVCFGSHQIEFCPIDGSVTSAVDIHGIVFEIVTGRSHDVALVSRFRQLVPSDIPVRVTERQPTHMPTNSEKEN